MVPTRPVLAMLLAASAMLCSCSRDSGASAVASGAPAAAPAAIEPARLVGRWIRPDGGYVLEILAAREGGLLEVRYSNPRPIHVGRAAWRHEDEKLLVTVVLQDANYPGSTYELVYVAAADRLGGDYYLPASEQHFDVEFVRVP